MGLAEKLQPVGAEELFEEGRLLHTALCIARNTNRKLGVIPAGMFFMLLVLQKQLSQAVRLKHSNEFLTLAPISFRS